MKVDTTVMMQQANEMRSVTSRMAELREAVLQAGVRLEGESISEQFYPLLAIQARKMDALATDVEHLRQTLEQISETYQNYEKRIVDHVELDDQQPEILADTVQIVSGIAMGCNGNPYGRIQLTRWIFDRPEPRPGPRPGPNRWEVLVPRWRYPRPAPGPAPRPGWWLVVPLSWERYRPLWRSESTQPTWATVLGGDV